MTTIVVQDVTSATATVTWFSDEAGTSQIKYGTTTAYGLQSEEDVVLRHDHSVTIGGLVPGTDYHFRIL